MERRFTMFFCIFRDTTARSFEPKLFHAFSRVWPGNRSMYLNTPRSGVVRHPYTSGTGTAFFVYMPRAYGHCPSEIDTLVPHFTIKFIESNKTGAGFRLIKYLGIKGVFRVWCPGTSR